MAYTFEYTSIKQFMTIDEEVIELYTEDGCDRPFFCILETLSLIHI